MELPFLLRRAVEQALEGVPLTEPTQATARLSERYRGETLDWQGRIDLKLCCATGIRCKRTISKRDGVLFKTARRSDWGDTTENAVSRGRLGS